MHEHLKLTMIRDENLRQYFHIVQQNVIEIDAELDISLEVLQELNDKLYAICVSEEQIYLEELLEVEVTKNQRNKVPIQFHYLVQELQYCYP